MKAVIIDDEIWSRRMIRSLGRWDALGIEIAGEAENGYDGLALIAAAHPDIVLLDMRMPGMEGTELIRRLNEQGNEAKVIVVSGHADFQYTKHAIDYKASTYILKPIDEDELNGALERCVRELRLARTQRERELRSVHYTDEALQALTAETKRDLTRYLHGLDRQGVQRTLGHLASALTQRAYASEAGLRKLYMELYLLLEDFVVRSDGSMQDIAERTEGPSVSRPSGAAASPEALVDGLSELYGAAIGHIAAKRKNKEKLDMGEIKSYIDRNYERQISLESVAEAFYVTKEYLSKAFKAQTGVNLTEYVIRLRMDKARSLVCGSELKIKDIALSVGYEDVTYFNRLFKQQFGETPGRMRERPAP
ncbi:response regulator transcription factor [Cohnella sp. 56]|uniref:response regulator transcription factor n=1 Tax=Cohnella sp. 56 TaxID=3113722 RepID=UPI0030E94324